MAVSRVVMLDVRTMINQAVSNLEKKKESEVVKISENSFIYVSEIFVIDGKQEAVQAGASPAIRGVTDDDFDKKLVTR